MGVQEGEGQKAEQDHPADESAQDRPSRADLRRRGVDRRPNPSKAPHRLAGREDRGPLDRRASGCSWVLGFGFGRFVRRLGVGGLRRQIAGSRLAPGVINHRGDFLAVAQNEALCGLFDDLEPIAHAVVDEAFATIRIR